MLDSIKWGNPLREHLDYLENNKCITDKFFNDFSQIPFPKNSSKGAREELNMLVDYVNSLSSSKDTAYLKRYQQYDRNLEQVFAHIIREKELDENSAIVVDEINADITPLIYKLKYHFNRPRPSQLAADYRLKLFPYQSYSALSPSYPSAHVIKGIVICHVLGNHYPHLYQFFENLSKEIGYSRLYMGLNYQSDNDFGVYIAEKIVSDTEFMEKYHL